MAGFSIFGGGGAASFYDGRLRGLYVAATYPAFPDPDLKALVGLRRPRLPGDNGIEGAVGFGYSGVAGRVLTMDSPLENDGTWLMTLLGPKRPVHVEVIDGLGATIADHMFTNGAWEASYFNDTGDSINKLKVTVY